MFICRDCLLIISFQTFIYTNFILIKYTSFSLDTIKMIAYSIINMRGDTVQWLSTQLWNQTI